MAGTGPAPDPRSRRQSGNQASSWTDLPAGGYTGPVPDFPLSRPSEREFEVWASVWRTPQAVVWAANGWLHDVAMYTRYLVKGEASLEHAKEARMWSDRLGLNPTAMLKNHWRVRGDELVEKRARPAKAVARRRLKVADDGVAGT